MTGPIPIFHYNGIAGRRPFNVFYVKPIGGQDRTSSCAMWKVFFARGGTYGRPRRMATKMCCMPESRSMASSIMCLGPTPPRPDYFEKIRGMSVPCLQ